MSVLPAVAAASAAAAATVATVAAATATAAATTIAIFARLSNIDRQATSADFVAVELLDGRLALFLGGHLDEAEAA